jgi:peptidoglycan/LPS O-acetylase OafA/YrhL
MNAAATYKPLPTFQWLAPLLHGVDFFFVISGFIIFFVHRDDIGDAQKARAFVVKRFIRLYPTLWIVVPIFIAASIVAHKPIDGPAVISSMLLNPSMTIPLPDVVWTLRHEVLFYISFVVLVLNRRLGIALYALWTAAVLVQLVLAAIGRPIQGLPSFFLSTYELDFVLGGAIAIVAPKIRAATWPILVALVAVIGALAIGQLYGLYRTSLLDYTSISSTWWVLALGVCFAGLLYGLLALDSLVKVQQWLVSLGGASYALYLVHVPIQDGLAKLAGHLPGSIVLASMVIVPLAVATGFHQWIERPLSHRLRKALLAPAPSVLPK